MPEPRLIKRIMRCRSLLFTALAWLTSGIVAAPSPPRFIPIGAAEIDITPDYPIRLTGYVARHKESEGAGQQLRAKALAMGGGPQDLTLVVTVDNCGVCANVTEEVAARLKTKAGVLRDRIAFCSSHTHSAPWTVGFAANIFAEDLPAEQMAKVQRYTKELTDKLEQVALAALADRKPGRLAWASGAVGFAANRRTNGGPVDRSVPILCALGPDGQIRAVLANYACHCTTLGADFNQTCADWVGFAGEKLESKHPGMVALVAIGCGADANPQPRGGKDGGLAFAQQHGAELAEEVESLLANPLTDLAELPQARLKRIDLPFQTHFTREQWVERSQKPGIVGYHARKNLARLDRGEALPTTLPYVVQTWTFNNRLAMVFLAGEVVVDYSLRLKRELDPNRLWINAYANDVPCYIPSKRILQEGGYEAEDSLWYYDRPARLAPETEDLIVQTVESMLPGSFANDQRASEFPPPKSPEESLATFRTKPGFKIQLVASEPLIESPVAIDWGADGKLWVVEMRDFPMGVDGKWKPGGRVKFLEDTDGDGVYDKATVFLDAIPFPTGVTAYGRGVLACAAPDIILAEDTDGDGKPDLVKKLFSGFATDNYQARVNSLSIGLDNWMYGANGLIGGVIHGMAGAKEINISGRDFRFHVETAEFEPASGLTQQGRVRDDWDNWFGCDNSVLLWHYPLPEHALRRNPYVPFPDPKVNVANDADPNQLYPRSRTLRRFNDPGSANRTTSACGLGLYRDNLLGDDFYGNAFVCEPVHNLVHRLQLTAQGASFGGRRADDEQQSEFFAARDNWCRPVQVRTGPDGALWIVDMYRFVVEHPRWITADRLKELDLRAGADMGRIYRIVPTDKPLRPIRDLTKLDPAKLVAAMDSPNGTERDRVHLYLAQHATADTAPKLVGLFHQSTNAAVRVQALSRLQGVTNGLSPTLLLEALADPNPGVRQQAIRLTESLPSEAQRTSGLATRLIAMVSDPAPEVRLQLSLTLGSWKDAAAGPALASLAIADLSDPWIRAAVLSSAIHFPADILEAVVGSAPDSRERTEFIGNLIATAVGIGDKDQLGKMAAALVPATPAALEGWRLQALASLLDALDRQNLGLDAAAAGKKEVLEGLLALTDSARRLATNDSTEASVRAPAIGLLGRKGVTGEEDLAALAALLTPREPAEVQTAALKAIARTRSERVPGLLLEGWPHHSPPLRSAVLGSLLSRPEWLDKLLDAIEAGQIGSADISAADRQRLLKHPRAEVTSRARKLFAMSNAPTRTAVIEHYQTALRLMGDQTRGGPTFARLCATCHLLRGQGHEVGPNLAALTDKSAQFLLTSILDPNAAVADTYVAYNLETRDGRSLSGILTAETASSLTLVGPGGVKEAILRSEIADLRASHLSLMPEGLEQGLSPEDLADLIAYVQRAPAPFGSATDEQATKARAALKQAGLNGFARLLAEADQLAYPSWLGTLPMHYCRETDGQGKVRWETAPVPASISATNGYRFRLPAAMGFASQPPGHFALTLNQRAALEFDVTLADHTWESSDGQVRLTYTVVETNAEDSNGVLELEAKGSWLEAGKPALVEVAGSQANSQRWFGIYSLPAD